MSATIRCPHPARCAGVVSHVAGSKAAIACATPPGAARHDASPPLPATAGAGRLDAPGLIAEQRAALPTVQARGALAVAQALRTALARQEKLAAAAEGRERWKPRSGAAHPTGGYTRISVRNLPGRHPFTEDSVEALYLNPEGWSTLAKRGG